MWGLNDVLTYSIAYGMGEEEGRAKAEKEKKKESPWHTGTPTEDGLYAVYYLNDNNPTGEEYETLCDMFVSPVFNDGCVERWVNYNRCLVFDADEIVRWQKIEPFVEATE